MDLYGSADVEQALREPPEPIPAPLARAAGTVARDLHLDEHWLNTGPALQWRTGLPPGLAGRDDLIFFKLFAAADSSGPRSVHYQVTNHVRTDLELE